MEISPLAGTCAGSLLFVFLLLGFAFLRGSQGLRTYIIRRVLLTIPMVFILVTVIFFVMRVIPGDPVTSQLGPRGGEELREQMTRELGLDKPIMVQYFDYLGGILTLDMGNSLIYGNRPIVDELSERMPATLELIFPAMVLSVLFGVLMGTFAAEHRKGVMDYLFRMFGITAYSVPVFWLGLMLQIVFALWLADTPLGMPVAGRIDAVIGTTLQRQTNFLLIDSVISGNWPAFFSVAHHLILPVASLALILLGVFLRLSRINVIESLVQDYIYAARARGINEGRVVYRHALGNALIPIVALIGLQFSVLLAGAVLTETTFSWPGMGLYLVERIGQRDYTAVQGVITIFAMSVSIVSLVTDVVYAFIDPRIRY